MSKILEWGSRSDVHRTDEYPELFTVEAESLVEAMKAALIFPLDKKQHSRHRCHCAFESGDTIVPDDGLMMDESTQTAGFILVCKVAVVGGIRGREAIFVLKKDSLPETWFVRCVETVKINSEGAHPQLLLDKIEAGVLHYSLDSKEERKPLICRI